MVRAEPASERAARRGRKVLTEDLSTLRDKLVLLPDTLAAGFIGLEPS